MSLSFPPCAFLREGYRAMEKDRVPEKKKGFHDRLWLQLQLEHEAAGAKLELLPGTFWFLVARGLNS